MSIKLACNPAQMRTVGISGNILTASLWTVFLLWFVYDSSEQEGILPVTNAVLRLWIVV
jgi:hypothetical protein